MLEDPINFEIKRMERIGDLFGKQQRVPSRLVMTYDQAKRYCPICGAVEPRGVVGGYLPRECEHLRDMRYAGQRTHDRAVEGAKTQTKQEQQATAQECYGWLGEEYSEEGLEHLLFETFIADTTARTIAKANAQTWAKEPDGTLILCGDSGLGKTHLACAIGNLAWSAGMLCRFTTGPNLFNAIADRGNYQQGYQDILKRLYSAPLLILDDIDAIPPTPTRQSIWFEVFNKRVNRRLPTVLTTNCALKEDGEALGHVLGERVASRLNVGLVLITLQGEDYRKRMRGRGNDE